MIRFIDALVYLYRHRGRDTAIKAALQWATNPKPSPQIIEAEIIKAMRRNKI